MRRRWSRAAIRRAIHILDLCAGSRDVNGSEGIKPEFDDLCKRDDLAGAAFMAAPVYWDSWAATYAEAAGMLRDGWRPGDPVVLRRRNA